MDVAEYERDAEREALRPPETDDNYRCRYVNKQRHEDCLHCTGYSTPCKTAVRIFLRDIRNGRR